MLRKIVECYWTVQGARSSWSTVYPDACMDILFNFGSVIESRTAGGTELARGEAYVIGNMFVPIETRTIGNSDLFGIRFRASGMGKVLRTPLHEFNDASLPLAAVDSISPDISQLQSLSIQGRIDLIDRWLLNHVSLSSKPELWEVCLHTITKRNGNVNVFELSREVGISQKQMERKFVEKVGPTPKQFAQLLRFRNVREVLSSRQNESLMNLAFDLNFTDHSHLTKFFQQFAHRTPTEFLRAH